MAFSREFRERVEKRLSLLMPIETRAMFGGVGIYSQGLFFALIASDKLYFKTNNLNAPDYEPYGLEPFSKGYQQVPDEIFEDLDRLAEWAEKARSAAALARTPDHKT